jgi:hypothetical protein
MINVQRTEVSGEPSEQHDISLGDRPSQTFPLVADTEIFEGYNKLCLARHDRSMSSYWFLGSTNVRASSHRVRRHFARRHEGVKTDRRVAIGSEIVNSASRD